MPLWPSQQKRRSFYDTGSPQNMSQRHDAFGTEVVTNVEEVAEARGGTKTKLAVDLPCTSDNWNWQIHATASKQTLENKNKDGTRSRHPPQDIVQKPQTELGNRKVHRQLFSHMHIRRLCPMLKRSQDPQQGENIISQGTERTDFMSPAHATIWMSAVIIHGKFHASRKG
jgi:hypothetical protein